MLGVEEAEKVQESMRRTTTILPVDQSCPANIHKYANQCPFELLNSSNMFALSQTTTGSSNKTKLSQYHLHNFIL
jgi:hypothetical protein